MDLSIGQVLCGEQAKSRVEWQKWRGEWFRDAQNERQKGKVSTHPEDLALSTCDFVLKRLIPKRSMGVREDAQTCHHYWTPANPGRGWPALWAVQTPHEANHRYGGEKSGQEELFAFILRYLIRQQEREPEGKNSWRGDKKSQVQHVTAKEVQAREDHSLLMKFS